MPSRRVPAAPVADEVIPPAPRGADPEAWRLLVTQGGAVTAPEETAEDEAENDFAAKIRECLGSSGDAMRVDLFRYSTFTKSREHCRSYDAEEFLNGNYELVRREFGGGTFEWRLIGATGIKARGHMKLAQQVNPAPASAPAPAASAAAELAPVLGAIMQGQQALAETLARIAATPPAPPVDPMAQMMQMMTLAKTMREAFAPPPAPAAPSGLAALKEAAETARMLRDIAGESETETDPLLSTARPLIGALTDMLSRKNNPGDNAAPLQPVQLPAAVQHAPAPAPELTPEERDEMDTQALLTRLVQMAKENQPAEKGGEEIFHYLPDSLLPFLSMPNWFDLLAARIPELTPHRAWLEAAKTDADRRFAAPPENGYHRRMFLAPSPRYTATLKGAPSGNRGALFTVGIMRQLVNDWKTDPRILNLASSIVYFQPQQDWLSECRELFNYVQNSIRYQFDVLNVETLATPLVTINRRAGDCDDKATLLATFFEAVGHPTRFIMGNYEGRGWDHVFLQVNLNGEWINADPCMEGPLGSIQPGAVEFWIEE